MERGLTITFTDPSEMYLALKKTKINLRVSRFSLSDPQYCLHATLSPEVGEPDFKSAQDLCLEFLE